MPELSSVQISDLQSLKEHCEQLNADLVVIGAIAYQIHFPGEERHTGDVDIAVALDFDDFALLEKRLRHDGWNRQINLEHRWRSGKGTILDLIPAGPTLRSEKKIEWPVSGMTMSLVGFDHVFSKSEPAEMGAGLTLKVAPIVVLMLLKIVAFTDAPERRAKDLGDIRRLLRNYESRNDERIFSDEVIEANLEDYSVAPAFLLGRDLSRLCDEEEAKIVHEFVDTLKRRTGIWMAFVRSLPIAAEADAQAQIEAFRQGFSG